MAVLRAYSVPAALLIVVAGCQTPPVAPPASCPSPAAADAALVNMAAPVGRASQPLAAASSATATAAPPRPLGTVSFQEPPPLPSAPPDDAAPELLGEVLSREALAAEIEARNPSLEAMIAAWQAAAQRYPQRVALDDPMLMGMIAPESAGSAITETAYALQLNQKLPWFGKRPLRGEAALAEAEAAFHEAQETRLALRLASDAAFFEYFLASRLLEINRENLRTVEELRETARARYLTNQVTQQDVLQAELELADLARRQLELVRMRQVATARINTLLRRWPDAPLPSPPTRLEPAEPPADVNLLWQTALAQRPDLAALAARVDAAEAELALAYKNYRPDVDVFGRYDTFWQPSDMQGPLRAQIGLTVNVPVWREKLRAAVGEAQWRANQRRAEWEQRSLEIQYEVVAAAQQVEESRQTIELFRQRLLPAAEQNVAAARANYEVNRMTFVELATAQRQLIAIRERQIEAIVAYQRRLAELERALGGVAPTAHVSPAQP